MSIYVDGDEPRQHTAREIVYIHRGIGLVGIYIYSRSYCYCCPLIELLIFRIFSLPLFMKHSAAVKSNHNNQIQKSPQSQ